MRCPNCGNENPPDYVFCDECGARLLDDASSDAASAPDANAQEGNATPGDESAGGTTTEGNQEQAFSSMVVTPRLEDTPQDDNESQPEATDMQMASESVETSGEQAPATSDVPVTEDTMSSEGVSGQMSGVASMEAEPMPDVVEMDTAEATDQGASMVSPPDISPAASGAPSVAGDGAAAAWASTALGHLDLAQQSMARGDYTGYGQSLASLRSLLESIAGGTEMQETSGALTPAPMSSDQEYSHSAASAASSPESLGNVPMVEPAAEAGTLAAEPMMSGDGQDEATAAASVATAVPSDTEGTGMARLVVISTGAELSLPEQEEISVGREDPSSGIFPDVDLTPYGGEEGGVSRRHARLLFIGNEYFVEDLQSTNFTKLDGQRLPAHAREKIEDGARLDFGRVAVIFRRS